MLHAGMNIARLNLSHGTFDWHKATIGKLRRAGRQAGKRLTIMADLPGPKIRIGQLAEEPITLQEGDAFTLTTKVIIGDRRHVSVNFPRLPAVVKPGDIVFLNDGIVQLKVTRVEGKDVHGLVLVGGELRSHKGLNLPGIKLGISAFTRHDQECLRFALQAGVDAISQSFVENARDVNAVRKAASELGCNPFIIAKIERAGALIHIDEILKAADGIMIARGDLGVETPLGKLAVVQKELTLKSNLLGKPVITATQMLASMVDHSLPTRAEATDVANAILDGTDCVMLSEESAMGQHPIETVNMLVKIAAATEPSCADGRGRETLPDAGGGQRTQLVNLISRNVCDAAAQLAPSAVLVPTATGNTARMVARYRLPVWIAAISLDDATCHGLQFSRGIAPVHLKKIPKDWNTFAKAWVSGEGLADGLVVLAEGPSPRNPLANHRVEIIDFRPAHDRAPPSR